MHFDCVMCLHFEFLLLLCNPRRVGNRSQHLPFLMLRHSLQVRLSIPSSREVCCTWLGRRSDLIQPHWRITSRNSFEWLEGGMNSERAPLYPSRRSTRYPAHRSRNSKLLSLLVSLHLGSERSPLQDVVGDATEVAACSKSESRWLLLSPDPGWD